jgi:hypothetical protein
MKYNIIGVAWCDVIFSINNPQPNDVITIGKEGELYLVKARYDNNLLVEKIRLVNVLPVLDNKF